MPTLVDFPGLASRGESDRSSDQGFPTRRREFARQMGTSSAARFEGRSLGSSTFKEEDHMPTTIRSVLFASDLSESSDDVLRAAARIATHAGAELHAVHVAEENAWVGMGGETMMDMQRRIHEARRALTEQIERVAPEQTLKSARLVFGPPYRGIEERAREVAADLIVIGPHRRRAI